MKIQCHKIVLSLAVALGCSLSTFAQDTSYSLYAQQNYPTKVYFGDTHLHTKFSMDAYYFGNRRDAETAYRFARGEEVLSSTGLRARLRRPLDFLVVADHGANLGVLAALNENSPLLQKDAKGAQTQQRFSAEKRGAEDDSYFPQWLGELFTKDIYVGENFKRSLWSIVNDNAEKFNDPGKFTAFIGYEWTAAPGEYVEAHIHRVVIFKDGKEKTSQVLPFTRLDSNRPEDLWSYLENYENQTGGEVLAIPHNGNLSRGQLFALRDSHGQALTAEYASTRSRWEPLLEVTQIKGDSETHPVLSPTDEFADYATWAASMWPGGKDDRAPGWEQRMASEYARSALKLGLGQQAAIGINPFKFGMIGSTDAHTSLSGVAENNFWGKFSVFEPNPKRVIGLPDNMTRYQKSSPSGYAAVWATENTREALFEAMKRKETYATTGPRMTVRFFGGWDFNRDDAFKPDMARIGYRKGVPMGGDLAHAAPGKSPTFLVRAVKDPGGANLDRVQVVKGWRSKDGELHEKIYNVAFSDNRKSDGRIDAGAKIQKVGITVDVKNATYTNTIGDSELAVVWRDPEFNRNQPAFYYLRVLEIPTPSWVTYDASFYRFDVPKGISAITQERAYTSPIWYTP